MNDQELWSRFKEFYFFDRRSGFGIDVSRINFKSELLNDPRMAKAFSAMEALVGGAIANPDENRQVGHYWLRNSNLAPNPKIKAEIDSTLLAIKGFAADVHSGKISPGAGRKFKYALIIGIGGSALGPQFVNQALGGKQDPVRLYFFDNTDPDGMSRVLDSIPNLGETLCVVISKSGGTKETRNGQLAAKHAWKAAGLDFSRYFVAITGEGSELDKTAVSEKWLARFPMWDWVGGRTSELSAVGLLPAALQGIDVTKMLKGASDMDALTASSNVKKNPAALLALMWYHTGSGKGLKDMVVLPYKDRLELFSKYLQQLLMESLGKEKDLDGKVVNQGIAVYGNKGSTDQHAYVQQLRDGLNNFFVVFIEVLKDRSEFDKSGQIPALEVEPGITSGDYLSGFFQGTRRALYESNRESVTITVDEVSPHSVGMLIALFERAVGFYATLINVNAYHQPGVEAGKKAATAVLNLQQKVVSFLQLNKGSKSVEDIAKGLGDSAEGVFKILRHLAANDRVKVKVGEDVLSDLYEI